MDGGEKWMGDKWMYVDQIDKTLVTTVNPESET